MNAFMQLSTGILGSEEDVASLVSSDTSRILVLSDTHGHYNVVEAVVREFGPDCDALLFAGDGMWDIVQYIENAQEVGRLRDALPPVVAFVAGNGDGDQYRVNLPVNGEVTDPDEIPGYTISVPSRQIVRASGYGILLVHGHRHSVDANLDILVNSARAMDCDIVVFGHTHVPMGEDFSNILALNPGSPAKPRGRSKPSFAIISLDSALTTPSFEQWTVSEKKSGHFSFRQR